MPQPAIIFLLIFALFGRSCLGMAVLEKQGESRVCDGTNVQLSTNQNQSHHLRNLRERYQNCTYVQGNLEITHIFPGDDLRFLSQIREVTGYVLISQVQKEVVPLPSLRVIRGRTLFLNNNGGKFALWVAANSGLRELGLASLQEIMRGDVLFGDNPNLCYVKDKVDWNDILSDNTKQNISLGDHFDMQVDKQCSPCSPSCQHSFCWGPSSGSCQKLSKSVCASQCHPGRCFGPGARECCHHMCVAGCYGPAATNCLACKVFEDDGVCVQDCPSEKFYDQETLNWKKKPNSKLAYGNTCVLKCPNNLLQDDGACVRECPERTVSKNGTCTPCDGPCPKICRGFSNKNEQNKEHGLNFITELTIQNFHNCTIIEGNLIIVSQTFNDGTMEFPVAGSLKEQRFHPAIIPADLEQLSTIKEITGYVRIDGSHPDLTNLSFLRNLEVIHGRSLEDKFAITVAKSSYLTSLGLNSLKKISGGGVRVVENKELCFADTVAWRKMTLASVPIVARNNKPVEICKAAGQTCHPECSSDGCWGPNPDQCLSCAHFQFGKTCISSCKEQPSLYDSGNKACETCHEQCLGGCHGPGSENCTTCRNVKDGLHCKSSCPLTKYKDDIGVCQLCSTMCAMHPDRPSGCTGNGNYVGIGGCRSCEEAGLLINRNDSSVVDCLPVKICPERYYTHFLGPLAAKKLNLEAMTGKVLCQPCHPLCKKCQSDGIHCEECVHFKEDEKCVTNCSQGTHYQQGNRCLPCSPQCSPTAGCFGPLSTQCIKCKNQRDYHDPTHPASFNCTSMCPAERQYSVRKGFEDTLEPSESQCTVEDVEAREEEELKRKRITLGCSIGLGIPIIGIIIYVCLAIYKEKTKKKSLQIMERFAGIEVSEPFTPTDIKPNTSKLRIFSEKELRRGRLLGQGAFGFVYQGLLVPATENKRIPVAIKELKEGLGAAANQEVMEEARVMASVQNSYLVPLIGICMTTPTILITQLLPLGCLLDYVKNNETQIKSKNFLNWCSQIARGMKYLEEMHMLHRDLAARNVLVQTPNWVKVTDFGLAKMLDVNESAYKAGGGRMPVKWLAPECIERSIYSHKTDVWAFGVTVWEILTYGDKPYDNIAAKNLLEKLEAGERLAQPTICSMDVYYLMLKCWSSHPENRPAFTELASEFGKMVRDPGRFLIIPGDEYLRLPDFTHADEQRMLREFDDQGEEEFMTAEEYINPGPYRFEPSLVGTVKRYQNGHIGPNGQGPQSWQHSSLPVFTNVSAPINDSRGAWSVDRKDSPPHSRYAMDPVKGVGRYDEAVAASNRKGSGAVLVGPDDYLIPTDHTPASNEAYLDLTESLRERDASLVEEYQKMPLMSGRRPSATHKLYPALRPGGVMRAPTGALVNNPEYHLFSSGASSASTESAPSQTASNAPLAPDDIEDDSDHEYYNDFGAGRTRREMIPLNHQARRNETTV